jgi:seryl-tRNA synthetase
MFSRIKKDFESAVKKIKWFSSLLSERIRIEITVFKLLYKSEELKKRRDELMKKIGEEVYRMREKERNIYADKDIKEAIRELETLEPEIKETIEKASEISRIVA